MKLGPRGEALIKRYERLSLTAYLPTPNDVPTIGWGSTRGVKLGMTITREQADQRFTDDTATAVAAVNSIVNAGMPLSQSQFDALVSLAFNAGTGAVKAGSTVGDALRARKHFEAWRGMALWTRQAGRDLRGLAARRAAEMSLYLEDALPSSS